MKQKRAFYPKQLKGKVVKTKVYSISHAEKRNTTQRIKRVKEEED
tara:strand:- start:254 stop:388 length:135 start_codon:yes stop_codon:yes gene_type:complete